MTEKSDVRQNLIRIFKEVSLCEEGEFIDNQPLNDLFDSLTFIEIYNEIDDEYPIEAELEELVQLKTFDEVVALVVSKLEEQSSAD